MTSSTCRVPDGSRPELIDNVLWVRQLDPECDIKAVERFFEEIAAAVAVLKEVNPIPGPLPVAFHPRWPGTDTVDD